mgnify:CR=1 FL=1
MWLQVATQVLGFSPREALLLTPGTLLDLLALEGKRRGWRAREEDA